MTITPFRIEVAEAVLEDLRERLGRTRFPDELEGVGWEDGVDPGYLKELVGYWKDRYDWRAAERALNRFPQYRAEVQGLGIHFIHQPGVGPDPLPLVVTHGWPGSVVEFTRIIGPLADPAAHGGEARDAFHVVAPSLPGYGFSDHPKQPGTNPARIAELWVDLMGQLGYRRFGAQGGDWGAAVSTALGGNHPEHLIGVHLNMPIGRPPQDPAEYTEEDRRALAERERWQQQESAYARLQGTKPQTIGTALNDSPAGLAAWIVEKFRTWSDCGGDVESRFSRDDLLTNITIYWVTESPTSSARLYWESARAGGFGTRKRVEVPVGCAIFPKEIVRGPRSWAERALNVVRWTEMAAGGHFAAMEEPEALVEDIRAFFRPLRG
jgi:pimeloyl-ACP methyl ester carboxylesterase